MDHRKNKNFKVKISIIFEFALFMITKYCVNENEIK